MGITYFTLFTQKMGKTVKRRKLTNMQKEGKDPKSTPNKRIARDKQFVVDNEIHNEDNPQELENNELQIEQDNNAQLHDNSQRVEDNAIHSEENIEGAINDERHMQGRDACLNVGKKSRGPTKARRLPFSSQELIEVEFNGAGEAIGDGSVKLSSFLGPLVREVVPVTLTDWRQLTDDLRDVLWESIQVTCLIC